MFDQNQTKFGTLEVLWMGRDNLLNKYNFMVMELLGPNLQDLFDWCRNKFSLKTVMMLGIQCLSIIEYLHFLNFVHNDIKPENFAMGLNEKSHLVYLIDFGIAKKFRDQETSKHMEYKENKVFIGSLKFLSINGHLGINLSRRDDLESLGYMLIYFLKSYLPWQDICMQNTNNLFQKIREKKQNFVVEEFCDDLPEGIIIFMNYVRDLNYDDKPDYVFLKKLLQTVL